VLIGSMNTPIYAIGDIHGQLGMLEDALDLIDRDGGGRVVFLGDYVDRGPDSRGVVDLLSRGLREGRDWICLKGNHDRFFEWFLENPPRQDPHLLVGYHWFHEVIGGSDTIAAYGIALPKQVRLKDLAMQVREAVPQLHMDFLRELHLSHAEQGLFFAHAGVRPGVALDRQDEEDLLWIRQEFLKDTRDHGAFIVHGHTPVMQPERHPNRVNLDTGAGYARPLSVAVFDDNDCFVLGRRGREAFPDL
jgi:serine/threonine protein phosphatase 1